MVHSNNYEDKEEQEASQATLPRRPHQADVAQDPEGEQEAAVTPGFHNEDPWWPSFEEATEANVAAKEKFGQPPVLGWGNAGEDGIRSALDAPQKHYYGMFGAIDADASPDPHERTLEAAAKMGYHVGESQGFDDGNKRTARALVESFLENNGYGHMIPEGYDDEEYADHLKGYGMRMCPKCNVKLDQDRGGVCPQCGEVPADGGQPRHNLQQTIDMFKQRYANGPDPSYEPYPDEDENFGGQVIGFTNPRLAAMTRTKKLEYANQLDQQFGPDTSSVQHEFPDGWSIRRLEDYGDMNREGEMMSNCWARSFWQDPANMQKYRSSFPQYTEHHEGAGIADPNPNYSATIRPKHWSLRDPDNLPRVSFHDSDEGGQPWAIMGAHNAPAKDEYRDKIREWQQAKQGERWGPGPMASTANILDAIHDELDASVWDEPESPEPRLRPEHRDWIYQTLFGILGDEGYDGMENWASIVVTGSLTTYQYSEESDCDISLFVDTKVFPDWSRAEMIALMIHHFDGTMLPGTTHPMQCFVVSNKLTKNDLYQEGMRSGYDLEVEQWIVPPEKDRVHDVEHEMNVAYTLALECADKMELLLKYEPDHAVEYYKFLHQKRMDAMVAGKGDYSPENIVYKMLNNRGMFEKLEAAGAGHIGHIAH